MTCQICGEEDLFSAVAQQPACAICVYAFGLWTPIRPSQIETVRAALGLDEGQYLEIDRAKAAAIILGREVTS